MKSTILLYLMLLSYASTAQQFAIGLDKNNIAILGVDNPLTCVVQKYPSKIVVLTSNNGIVTNQGDGRYNFRPKEIGTAEIIVKAKTKKGYKQIGIYNLRVHSLPEPTATIGGSYTNGSMTKAQFIAMGGVIARLKNSDFEAPFQVLSYQITAIHENNCLFNHKNIGAVYNDSLKENLSKIMPGDKIIIYDVLCRGASGDTASINTMVYTIKE